MKKKEKENKLRENHKKLKYIFFVDRKKLTKLNQNNFKIKMIFNTKRILNKYSLGGYH